MEMEQTISKTALIVGATGLIGNQLLDLILGNENYEEVRVLVRKPLGRQHPRLVEIVYDFDKPTKEAVTAADIFCCLGTTMKKAGSKEAFFTVDHEYPMQIARLSLENGAKRYLIVTAMGADPESTFFYNRVKGEVEEDLRSLGFEAVHFFRPTLLLGNRNDKRSGETISEAVMRFFDPVLIGPLKKYRSIESSKVAKAMLALAQKSQKGIFIHESTELESY
jgi:uncharacterized protein YbjT (DUF2867 family)